MTDTPIPYICRASTTFSAEGRVDVDAFRHFLQRFVESNLGVYVASSGSGAGQALRWEELRAVYETAVAVGRGTIPVGANIPEQYTSARSIEHAQLAITAGVEIVNIYGPDGRHGFRPTDLEYLAYFDRILAAIKHPISVCPNPAIGYAPKASVIAAICNKHRQVQNVLLSGIRGGDTYFVDLQDALSREVDLYATIPSSLSGLALGAAGVAGQEANYAPKTVRDYLDAYAAHDDTAVARTYGDLERLATYTRKWTGGAPRASILYLRAFKLPGGAGVLPDPYITGDDAELARFTTGMLELRIPEIDELARAAGLSVTP